MGCEEGGVNFLGTVFIFWEIDIVLECITMGRNCCLLNMSCLRLRVGVSVQSFFFVYLFSFGVGKKIWSGEWNLT